MISKKLILAGVLFAFLATTTILPLAVAQVYPIEKNGPTFEEELYLQDKK